MWDIRRIYIVCFCSIFTLNIRTPFKTTYITYPKIWIGPFDNLILTLLLTSATFFFSGEMSQCTTKPTKRLSRLAKTQISLRIRAVWSESSLIAFAFYNPHPPSYPKRGTLATPETLATLNGCTGRCLCWSHRSYCRFCRALVQFSLFLICLSRATTMT